MLYRHGLGMSRVTKSCAMAERKTIGRRLYVPDLMQNTSGPNAGRACAMQHVY